MKRVYIAGKLSADAPHYIQNLHAMFEWANEVRKIGFSVFVPGLDFLMGLQFGNWEYPDYFNNSQEWLKVADFVFVCPGYEQSKGTRREIQLAHTCGIPVFYSIDELKKVM